MFSHATTESARPNTAKTANNIYTIALFDRISGMELKYRLAGDGDVGSIRFLRGDTFRDVRRNINRTKKWTVPREWRHMGSPVEDDVEVTASGYDLSNDIFELVPADPSKLGTSQLRLRYHQSAGNIQTVLHIAVYLTETVKNVSDLVASEYLGKPNTRFLISRPQRSPFPDNALLWDIDLSKQYVIFAV